MNYLSNFPEYLKEQISDNKLNIKLFSQKVGIADTTISNYLNAVRLPTVKNLVRIADFFTCSTDYLLGLEELNKNLTFKQCPSFSAQLKFLKDYFKCETAYFYSEKGVSKSRYFDWLKGERQPSIDNIVKLAKLFDCRVDFVLGRES